MSDNALKELQNKVRALEDKLAEAERQKQYYKNLVKAKNGNAENVADKASQHCNTGKATTSHPEVEDHTHLPESRDLSKLVLMYRQNQEQINNHREQLEELVRERTEKLERANEQLHKYIEGQRKTEQELQYRLALEHVILDISSEFINLPVEETDAGIQEALKRIGRFTNSTKSCVYLLSENTETVLNSHRWQMSEARSNLSDEHNVHDVLFGHYSILLRQNKNIVIQTPADLERLLEENELSAATSIFQPMLAVPLVHDGRIYASVVLYGPQGKTVMWPQDLIALLKIVGGIFVSALEQKVSEMALRESEERYREIVDKAGLAIVISGQDGSFHYFNQRFIELFGYSEEEMKRFKIGDLVHPEDRGRVIDYHKKRFERKPSPKNYELRGLKKDGSIVHLETEVAELIQNGHIIAKRSYLWDITKRVETERAIQTSEARYRNLIENLQDIVVILDYDGKLLYANPALERQIGFSKKDLHSFEKMRELVIQEDGEEVFEFNKKFMASREQHSAPFEIRLDVKNETVYYYSIIVSKINYMGTRALQYIGHDITNIKIAKDALKRSADFEKTVSEISSQFLGRTITKRSIHRALEAMGQLCDADRVYLYRIDHLNKALHARSEWCAADVPSDFDKRTTIPINNWSLWRNMFRTESVLNIPDTLQYKLGEKKDRQLLINAGIKSLIFLPFRVRGKYNSIISFERIKAAKPWSEHDMKLLKISSEIISTAFERFQADELLRKSEKQYRMLFESNNDQIFLHKLDKNFKPTRIINVNHMACKKLGYSKEELLKKTIYDMDPKEMHHAMAKNGKILSEKKSHIFETVHVTRTGETYPVEINAHIVEMDGEEVVLSIARDISERKQIEEERQKSQRLESIGVLAGGIAHDFNNLLTIILGNAQLVRIKALQQQDVTRYVNNIEQSAGQASHLTQQLLTFAKGGEPIKSITLLKDMVQESVKLALSGLDKSADFQIEHDLWPAKVDKGQIRQVLHNLVINAGQAMHKGGIVTVTARNVESSTTKALRALEHTHFVEISVRDTGVGIPKEELEKIFDPYFTTKDGGSGLGLTVAYSIVKKHKGLMTVESQANHGTTVRVYLPAVLQKVTQRSLMRSKQKRYSGKLLVMDDEAMVLDMILDMLNDAGFKAEGVTNGEELLLAYKAAFESGEPFDGVIMDLTISKGMGGKDAIKLLRKYDPNVKALVSSGYSNDKIMANYKSFGFDGIVAKPYTLEDLCDALTPILSGEDVDKADGE